MRNRFATPAVVVGGNLNALGVVRSLATGRMPIHVIETTRGCPAAWSKYSRYMHAPSLRGLELIEALERLASRFSERAVLILTSDDHVTAVSEHRHRIEPLYRISLPAPEIVRALADKVLFQRLAEREGFAVPRSVCLANEEDLALLSGLTAPFILKPSDKTLVLRGVAERVVLSPTLAEAMQAASEMLKRVPQVIAQEWIAGPDTDIFFTLFTCDPRGQLVGIFPGRKLVCVPPAIGGTAVCVSAPEVAGDLSASTQEFITRVGYRGLGSLEFKRDALTGRYLIIEPTVGRTDWQEEIATLCGVNLPLATYLAELGLCKSVQKEKEGYLPVAWRSSRYFTALLSSGTKIVDGFFRWSDPMPAVWEYGIENKLLPIWRRVAATFSGKRLSSAST